MRSWSAMAAGAHKNREVSIPPCLSHFRAEQPASAFRTNALIRSLMHRANGPAYLAVFFVAAGAIAGAQDIPLPRPRPPDVGGGSLSKASVPAAARAAPDEGPPEKSAAPPPPSACQLRLADEGAVAQILPPMVGPGECGAPDAVRLEDR